MSDAPAPEGPQVAARLAEVERAILARAPEHDLTPTLDRIRELLDLLGSPQLASPVIHVAGTNGKTSTTRMVDGLLHELGLRTGRFTSPHLHSVRERIAFDGAPVEAERFVATYDDIAPSSTSSTPATTSGCPSSRC